MRQPKAEEKKQGILLFKRLLWTLKKKKKLDFFNVVVGSFNNL